MTQASRPRRIRSVIVGAVIVASGIFPVLTATAHSKTAPSAQRARTSPAAHKRGSTAKTPAAARAINAEELQALLKRDGTRPLLVNYWATWCDPCRDEFPDLVKIDKRYRTKGLDFIAITLDDLADLNTVVPKFLRLMKAKMPVYLLNVADPEPAINSVDAKWGGSLPATFLYNKKGKLVYKHFGRIKTAEVRAAIDNVMSGKW